MNDSKYRASGSTQNSGMAEISVDMYVVTPSMRLDGTAARPIQRKRRAQVISSGSARPCLTMLGASAGVVAAMAAAVAGVATAVEDALARSRPLCLCLPPFLMPVAAGLEIGTG